MSNTAHEAVSEAETAVEALDAYLSTLPPELVAAAEAGDGISYRVRKALRLRAMGWSNTAAAAEAGLSDQHLSEVANSEAGQRYLRVVAEECVRDAARAAESWRLTDRERVRFGLKAM